MCGTILLPDPGPRAAGGGSPEQAAMYTMIMIHNIQLSRNFCEWKILFRELKKKTFARISNITCTAFAIKNPYKDL